MRRGLDSLNERNRSDQPFTAADVQPYVDFFDSHGTSNDQLLAYYLLGRSYHEQGEAPMALKYYQQAIECADTTSSDCDYAQLCRVYAQIGNVFYYQGLYRQELVVDNLSEYYAWKGKDTLAALLNYEKRIHAYRKLNMSDSVIQISYTSNKLYTQYGYPDYAAVVLSYPISTLIETGKMSEAKKNMDIYESKSGFFDSLGNIVHGREIYYKVKGYYYLGIEKFDSAEYFFRKELNDGNDFNNQNAASRGLAQLFQQKHIGDSAAKYALYSYEMNDSVYARMATNEVEQMKTLYDYSHNQEIAHQEKEKAKSEHIKAQIASVITLLIIIITIAVIRRERRKHKAALSKYEQSISDLAKVQADIIKLRAHKSEYEHLISNKEKEVNRLNSEIYLYKEKLGKQKESAESLLIKSQEYSDLRKYAGRGVVFSDEMWHKVDVMVIDILPNFYKFISSKKLELNDHEFKVCILIRLHLTPKEVANAIGLSPSSITKIRNNMMKKLFGMEGKSKELDEKLLQYS
jgi:tetratricopeptide (TPR) repeat protein